MYVHNIFYFSCTNNNVYLCYRNLETTLGHCTKFTARFNLHMHSSLLTSRPSALPTVTQHLPMSYLYSNQTN